MRPAPTAGKGVRTGDRVCLSLLLSGLLVQLISNDFGEALGFCGKDFDVAKVVEADDLLRGAEQTRIIGFPGGFGFLAESGGAHNGFFC